MIFIFQKMIDTAHARCHLSRVRNAQSYAPFDHTTVENTFRLPLSVSFLPSYRTCIITVICSLSDQPSAPVQLISRVSLKHLSYPSHDFHSSTSCRNSLLWKHSPPTVKSLNYVERSAVSVQCGTKEIAFALPRGVCWEHLIFKQLHVQKRCLNRLMFDLRYEQRHI